jgi:hypothetical protein
MCMLYVQEYFASVGLGRGGGYIAVGAAPWFPGQYKMEVVQIERDLFSSCPLIV